MIKTLKAVYLTAALLLIIASALYVAVAVFKPDPDGIDAWSGDPEEPPLSRAQAWILKIFVFLAMTAMAALAAFIWPALPFILGALFLYDRRAEKRQEGGDGRQERR